MPELKKCRCGGNAELRIIVYCKYDVYAVWCDNCDEYDTDHYPTPEEAVSAWETSPKPYTKEDMEKIEQRVRELDEILG